MGIDQTTECTTAELRATVGFRSLRQLASFKRKSKDCWLHVATLQALFAEARARSAGLSDARLQLEKAKAKVLELQTPREAGELAPLSEWRDAITVVTGKMVAFLVGLPA